jgi:hypothetical protein
MTVGAALMLDARAKWVLLAYHISGCGDCPQSDDETLAELAAGYRVDLARLLRDLNSLEQSTDVAGGRRQE